MQPCLTCAVQSANEDGFMNTKCFTVIALVAMGSFILNSCETPTGQGAGIGAATGAIIGAAATGHARGAAIGAAAGAAAGALTGAAIARGSSCALRSAATRRLSIRALGRHAGALLQPLHRARLRSSRRSAWGLTRDIDTGRLFRKP